jgi:cellulose synthase/poly-beta-1,6-N-acetylglucosamine synthase-like glycosyltransferase
MELTKDISVSNANTLYKDVYERELLKYESLKLGTILIEKGFINWEQLEHGLSIQKEKGGRIGWILLSLGYINRLQFFETQAQKMGKPFVSPFIDDLATQIDTELLKKINGEEAIKYQAVPLKFNKLGFLIILTAYPEDKRTLIFFKERFNVRDIIEWVVTDLDISNLVKKLFKDYLANLTIMGLYNRNPEESAYKRLSKMQIAILIISGLFLMAGFYFYPVQTLVVLFSVIQLFYFVSIFFKLITSIIGAKIKLSNDRNNEVLTLDIGEYPVYTVLVPLFKEPENVLKNLINSLKNIDYPQNKLDVIFLFEEHDKDTIEIAKSCKPPNTWRFFYVPNGTPTTKPKACNYGLYFSRGEYLVIYDAEDLPEPDQLKKALAAFINKGPDYSCFQAYLNYYNKDENFLTRMFTLEYTYWFDYMLNGLHALQLPIPLGGTSNHFRTEDLKKVSGWDPFNVTEDADLGIRFSAEGKKVGIIKSTTYEEANVNIRNWIRQRSRWVKGYMQTSIVYNRHPFKMIRKVGLKNWLSFQLLVTGTPLTFLINPIMWAVFLIWLFSGTHFLSGLLPDFIEIVGTISFLAGNIILIIINFAAVFSRKYYKLLSFAFLNPVYWVLHSVAAYKALWQLIFRPFYWEKTTHGLSNYKKASLSDNEFAKL